METFDFAFSFHDLGIIGPGPNTRKNSYSCSFCQLDNCIYRRKKTEMNF